MIRRIVQNVLSVGKFEVEYQNAELAAADIGIRSAGIVRQG